MLSHYVEPSWRGNGDTQTKGKIILVQDLSQFSFSFLSEWPRIARTWLSERELATIMFKSSEDDFRALVGGRCSRRV